MCGYGGKRMFKRTNESIVHEMIFFEFSKLINQSITSIVKME
jgi:hypothetical protein